MVLRSSSPLAQIWLGQLDEAEALLVLKNMGFTESPAIYQLLRYYARVPKYNQLSTQATQRLLAFIPALLSQVVILNEPLISLERTLDVVMAIVKRSAYLVLLLENPSALRQLVKLCTMSSWVTQELVHHPALLDELLSEETLSRVPTRHSVMRIKKIIS